MTNLSDPIFHDLDKAREALEAVRWPDGPVCPHCKAKGDLVAKIEGKKKSHRPGLHYCNACKGQFTVTVGTVFERSKVPLTKWWMATHLMGSSKKGISAHQIHRMLGVTYKTAWFMMHRIREAMKDNGSDGPLGGPGKTVEVDETYIGRRMGYSKASGPASKNVVVTLVERGGRARSFHIHSATSNAVWAVVSRNIARETALMTDTAPLYPAIGREFNSHGMVNHGIKEWRRGMIHTNTIEGFFSIFKRGMKGIYQHCAEHHLHRYLAEYDFRYSRRAKIGWSDKMRVDAIMEGIGGKRLTYRRADEAAYA